MFKPNTRSTIVLSATTAPQVAALPSGGGIILRVLNTNANVAFIETGSYANMAITTPAANVAGGFPVNANMPAEIMLRATDTHVAVVSTGNATVYLTRGDIA